MEPEAWIRTRDRSLTRRVLFQLSYRGKRGPAAPHEKRQHGAWLFGLAGRASIRMRLPIGIVQRQRRWSGSSGRTRTSNDPVNSRALCQLSYRRMVGVEVLRAPKPLVRPGPRPYGRAVERGKWRKEQESNPLPQGGGCFQDSVPPLGFLPSFPPPAKQVTVRCIG